MLTFAVIRVPLPLVGGVFVSSRRRFPLFVST